MVFNKQKFVLAVVCVSVGWIVGYQMGNKNHEEAQAYSWWSEFLPSSKNFKGKIIEDGMSVFGGGDTGDFKTREDDKFVYYEYEMDKVSKDSLNIRVENQMVIIEGSETKEAFGATINTSFHRAFPAPDNVNVDNVQMDYLDKKLIVKFPKFER